MPNFLKWPASSKPGELRSHHTVSSPSHLRVHRRLGPHQEGYTCISGSYAFQIQYTWLKKGNMVLNPPSLHIRMQSRSPKGKCTVPKAGKVGGLFRTAENSAAKSAVQINWQTDVAPSITSRNVIWNTSDRGQKVTQLKCYLKNILSGYKVTSLSVFNL